MSTKPYAATVLKWLKDNGHSLAPLTSGSTAALLASVQLVPLWGGHDSDIAAAWRACVEKMEEHTRQLAFHAIAHVYDWDDRYRMWLDAGFADLPVPCNQCKYEPEARRASRD